MSTIKTTIQVLSEANKYGIGLKSKYVSFLCSGLSQMGDYRKKLKERWVNTITKSAVDNRVVMQLKIGKKPVSFHMRAGNIADYLVGGEMVRGSYGLPKDLKTTPTSIVDGGANIGMFALVSHSYFPELPIICYEPDKDNLLQLKENLAANNIQAKVVDKALWSSEETLYYHPALSYSGVVNKEPSPFPIECCQAEINEGCWLKLDIEGSEYEVLPNILLNKSKLPLVISIEIHDFSEKGMPLIKLLEDSKYKIYGDYLPQDTCINITAILNKD